MNALADNPVSVALTPHIEARLRRGEYFNAYTTRDGYVIGLGPVSDYLWLADAGSAVVADLIVAALRAAAGQPPCAAPLLSPALIDLDALRALTAVPA